MSQVDHQAGAYPSFCSVKRLRISLLRPGWDTASISQDCLQGGERLFTRAERGTVRVNSPAQNAIQCSRAGLEPGSLDLDTSASANYKATAPPYE